MIVVAALLAVAILLTLISLWDSKQGAVDIGSINYPELPDDESLASNISIREPTEEEIKDLLNGDISREELINDLVDSAIVQYPDNNADSKSESTSIDVQEVSPSSSTPETHEISEPHISADGSKKEPTPSDTKPDNSDKKQSSTVITNDTAEADPSPSTDSSDPSVLNEYERRVAEITADAYILRGEYIIALETMYSEAEEALSALEEDNDTSDVAALVSDYLARASSLERQCDSRINTIVSNLEQVIMEYNGDPDIVDTLIETYANEKATKKAWYISRLEEKGLVSS